MIMKVTMRVTLSSGESFIIKIKMHEDFYTLINDLVQRDYEGDSITTMSIIDN